MAIQDFHAPSSVPPPPPPASGPWGGQQAPFGYGPQSYFPAARRTNPMAVASLVLALVSAIGFGILIVPQALAVIFGHVALSQIAKNADTQTGRGLAIGGLVVGYLMLALWLGIYVLIATSDESALLLMLR